MNNYDVVFFDWGGVIADDPGDEFLGQLLTNIGASEQQIKEIFQTYMASFMRGQIPEAEYWDSLRQKYGLNIRNDVSDEFMKWNGLLANERVLKLVEATKAQGIKAVILSNVIEPTYNAIDRAGYYTYFDDVIASCKVGYAKPQKEIYILALERMGVSAERCIFIDDKQANLDPAAAMGMKTILAIDANQIIEDINSAIR